VTKLSGMALTALRPQGESRQAAPGEELGCGRTSPAAGTFAPWMARALMTGLAVQPRRTRVLMETFSGVASV